MFDSGCLVGNCMYLLPCEEKKKKLNLEPLEKKVAEVYKMTNAVKNFLKRKMFTHFDTRSKRGLKSTKFYICYAAR